MVIHIHCEGERKCQVFHIFVIHNSQRDVEKNCESETAVNISRNIPNAVLHGAVLIVQSKLHLPDGV